MLISLIVGTLMGFLSGLGIGGGSLLILWLTLVQGMEQRAARTLNLLFFLPAAVAACCFRWKQGTLDWKKVFPAMIAGCIGAILGTYASRSLDILLLKKGFGFLLLATGFRELFYRPKEKASS